MESAKEKFESQLNDIAGDQILQTAKITIKLYQVAKSEAESFWNRVESMFLLNLNQEKADLASKQEIQKMLSYKNEEGWAILSKGPVAMITGRSSTFIKVLEKFTNWKDKIGKKNFEEAFKECYSEIMKSDSHCCRLDIPFVAGKAPERMKCAECERIMEMFISYKCCREGG
ncbi:hypothetical protein TIFTF001_038677 [Ficus carica]|uniref:Sieve element occlusion C-terminal domain-containing protein n=1 Tax=Ficus carica TaxID=3494 RepID=A0AA88E8H4_FICCA|nr:hypothetical protein TIFTF001_038677 [Ficus carica]